MNKLIDMVGQKFGKLTVVSKASPIPEGIKTIRMKPAWNCRCDCGGTKTVKEYQLKNGGVKSCGCFRKESESDLQVGIKKNRLTMLEYLIGKWKCKCDCGNIVVITTDKINNGNTKSCGCLNSESASARAYKLIEGRRQFEPRITSARRVWKNVYAYNDEQCVSFEEFLTLSQQNCYYCGIVPSNHHNQFATKSARGSQKAKEEGLFSYNGLDRIDASKHHTTDNVVSCCYPCNRAKNDRTVEEFLDWSNHLQLKPFEPLKIKTIPLPDNSYLQTSVKCVFRNHKDDTDLTLEEYYSISQMNCFYCDCTPSNTFNYAKSDKKSSQKAKDNAIYIYNGIDRVDRSFPHNKNNVVSSCKFCNWSKSGMTLSEFHDWIKRIQAFQHTKHQ
jgi:hypothetical protein